MCRRGFGCRHSSDSLTLRSIHFPAQSMQKAEKRETTHLTLILSQRNLVGTSDVGADQIQVPTHDVSGTLTINAP
jgi:hypothetical protein